MTDNLKVLRRFVETHEDTALLFPVHPNPVVAETTQRILGVHPRIFLCEPLGYEDFLLLLKSAWVIVSDSGGVQEEAPTLGKPVFIIRDNTERPEAIECGVARLVGPRSERLAQLLEEAVRPGSWVETIGETPNPFGRGDAAEQIVRIIAGAFGVLDRMSAPGTDELQIRQNVQPA
jgi:UDP-N-acetylglucosamine 2-epimerase (non-hydrolysing)